MTMDPNTLSMAQGKQFLKQCGIPQRDIDLMTEKWIVVASVEVLLRFPLRPGEDPRARCVSNKNCQPTVGQAQTVSQRQSLGDQEKRKLNDQSMSNNDQKAKGMQQMSGHYVYHRPQRSTKYNNLKESQRPVRPRVPRPEEEETTVKCKNCGAFGHTVRSSRCPMRCWGQALPFQPVGWNKEKENLKPRKVQELQTPGPFSRINREKEQGRRQEEQQPKTLPQTLPRRSPEKVSRSWKEQMNSFAYLRQPTRPLPVHIAKKRSAQGPILIGPPPVKTPHMRSFHPTQSYNKRPEVSARGPAKGCDVDSLHPALKNFCQNPALMSKRTDNTSTIFSHVPQLGMKTPALGHIFNPQAHIEHPDVGSEPSPQPISQKCGQDSKVRIQAPGKTSAQVPIQTCQKYPKKAQLSSFWTTHLRTQLPDLGSVQVSQPSPSTSGFGPKQAPKVTTKTPTLKPSVHLQSLPYAPCLSPAQDWAVFQPLLSSCAPGKLDRTGSMGSDKGGQCFGVRMAPTSNPPERCTPVGQSGHLSQDSEALCPHVPRSILYDDLLVSSSSEDSDLE